MRHPELVCPHCKLPMDMQPGHTEGRRVYQFGICDQPACAVSSVRIEWKTQ